MIPRRYVLLVALVCASCKDADPQPDYAGLGNFDTAQIRIVTSRETLSLKVEVAETEEQQKLGLMERTTLADGSGMLFVYDEVQDAANAFWMYRTKIPLDIAFVDSAGTIVSIKHMVPCVSPSPELCVAYPAGVRFTKALELPGGFTGRRGILVGYKLLID